MGLYTKALHHVSNKDFKKTHQRRCDEQKVLCKIEKKQKLQERKKIEENKKLSLPFKSDWRSELFVEEEYIGEVEQTKINVKVPERLKSNWRRDLDEAMSSKDFEYLYGMSISNIQISSVLNNVQSTTSQDILQASSDFVSYQFGKDFPGSFINSVGDNQINSQTNVDVVAFLDTSYGNVSGTDQSYRLTTGPEGLPPEGQSPPGSVVSRVNLETALGITLPSGVPNGALNGTPIEGSAIKRIFTNATPGRRINFNWTFASSEDFLGAATVDDYAFVAIKGSVTKFVSVLTRGLQYGGQFVYTVQPEDIVDGKVEIGIGVIDVFDPYVQTALNISNFGSFWGAGTLGDTTDAADLGMSVAAATPQSQQKKKSEELSKAVDAARAEYLKPGQTYAQIMASYDKLQAAIKASTDNALSGLKTPIIKPTPPTTQTTTYRGGLTTAGKVTGLTAISKSSVPPTPPKTQPSPKLLTPQQLSNLDKQIKDLQRQSEKNKQDAINNRWRAVGELAMGALQAAAILSPIPGDEAVVAAALAAKTGPKAAGAFAKANPGKYNPFLNQQTNKYLNLPRK